MKNYQLDKSLTKILPKHSGRNSTGKVTVRHHGGRRKRFYRFIDFKREKRGVKGEVLSMEYDPNRSAQIALVIYSDGEKKYILAPQEVKVGDKVEAGPNAQIKPGNALPLAKIPVGAIICNLELTPGKGGQIVRSAGSGATILAKEKDFIQVRLPSGEMRKVSENCYATIGQMGNIEHNSGVIGKAGRRRRMGWRPTVRGVAQDPRSHPHGGGEGRSGIGMPSPKSPWGKPTLGKRTRNKGKYSNKFILQRRK